mmetsp:Transcript_3049/g.4108  ORF Transcript_3049/g.4108 Transcript_3049/m.4108 type:complete len:127 (+) Transcript_3049:607-987(+)
MMKYMQEADLIETLLENHEKCICPIEKLRHIVNPYEIFHSFRILHIERKRQFSIPNAYTRKEAIGHVGAKKNLNNIVERLNNFDVFLQGIQPLHNSAAYKDHYCIQERSNVYHFICHPVVQTWIIL